MRHLLCEKCGEGKVQGTRLAFEASSDGPAEFERIAWGVALPPLPKNRVLHVNCEALQLPHGQYECDGCGVAINPGDKCCAHSAWSDHQAPTPAWEHEYLTPITSEATVTPRSAGRPVF